MTAIAQESGLSATETLFAQKRVDAIARFARLVKSLEYVDDVDVLKITDTPSDELLAALEHAAIDDNPSEVLAGGLLTEFNRLVGIVENKV